MVWGVKSYFSHYKTLKFIKLKPKQEVITNKLKYYFKKMRQQRQTKNTVDK